MGNNTQKQSIENYKNYCKNRDGPPYYDSSKDNIPRQNSQKLNQIIMEKAQQGVRASEMLREFGCSQQVKNMIYTAMSLRPVRQHRTDVIYIWGESGLRKTTYIHRTLEAIKAYYDLDYYAKSAGLSRFWDGYDNQRLVWLDDPVPEVCQPENKQQLRNVLSTGPARVEVKFGSMQFDAELLIISCNYPASQMAMAFGSESYEPLLRRFTDTCGEFRVTTLNKHNLPRLICNAVGTKLQIDINPNIIISRMYDVVHFDYTHLSLY